LAVLKVKDSLKNIWENLNNERFSKI
jgi:hypothetical protein